MLKRKIMEILTICIVTVMCVSVSAGNMLPLQEEPQEESQVPEEPQEESQVPEEPSTELPEIQTEFKKLHDGWNLKVIIPEDIKENATSIRPMYSFDGVNFLYEDFWELDFAYDSSYVLPVCEPMQSFLAGDATEFWFRLEIEGETYNGSSATVFISNENMPEIPSEDIIVNALLPNTYRVSTGAGRYKGVYNITIDEGCSNEELLSLLPNILPVNIQLLQSSKLVAESTIDYNVNWNLPDTISANSFTHTDVELIPPLGPRDISSPGQVYTIEQLPMLAIPTSETTSVPVPFELEVTMIPLEQKAEPILSMAVDHATERKYLMFTLENKPTGATAIFPEYSIDGGNTWERIEEVEIISLGNPVDNIPQYGSYTAPFYLDDNKSPMKEYAADNTKGFIVRLNIVGGVFDGVSESASWPAKYQYVPPPKLDNSDNGGEGNRGDAGTDNSGTGGIRPKPDDPVEDSLETSEKPLETIYKNHEPSEQSAVFFDKINEIAENLLEATFKSETFTENYGDIQNNTSETTKNILETSKNSFVGTQNVAEVSENPLVIMGNIIQSYEKPSQQPLFPQQSYDAEKMEKQSFDKIGTPLDSSPQASTASLPKALSKSNEAQEKSETSNLSISVANVTSELLTESLSETNDFNTEKPVRKQKETSDISPTAVAVTAIAVGGMTVIMSKSAKTSGTTVKAKSFWKKLYKLLIHPPE